jgi:signal transduction histidine kinase
LLGMAERVANLSGTMQSRKYKDLFIIKISIPL